MSLNQMIGVQFIKLLYPFWKTKNAGRNLLYSFYYVSSKGAIYRPRNESFISLKGTFSPNFEGVIIIYVTKIMVLR